MYIRHNISAINTIRQLSLANKNISKHTERLLSSLRVNRPNDDIVGLSISEKMRAQISGLSRASVNTQDSISLIQTAESALAEVHNMLIRGRELSVQAANDTNTNNDRSKLQQELNQILQEINHIGNNTEFNTKKLLAGTEDKFIFQLGANSSQNIEFSIGKISTNDLAIVNLNIESQSNANDAIAILDKAIKKVSDQKSNLGAVQNRLGHTIFNNGQTGANLTSAESIIRDANIANEAMKLTKNEILQDTMQSVAIHSNIKNSGILQLLN